METQTIEEIVDNFRFQWEVKGELRWEMLLKDLNKFFREKEDKWKLN